MNIHIYTGVCEYSPPSDSRPGSLNFLTRSQSPGSLKVYFFKWVSYIVILEPVVTCFWTHRNKLHATGPLLSIFIS